MFVPESCSWQALGVDECEAVKSDCEASCDKSLSGCTCTQAELPGKVELVAGVPIATFNYKIQCEDIYVGLDCLTRDTEDECKRVNGCKWNSGGTQLGVAAASLATMVGVWFML